MMQTQLLEILYLFASISFVLGLKWMNHPDTARRGNLLAAVGMTLAVFGTIFLAGEGGAGMSNKAIILLGLVVGTVIGTVMARRVKMTGMPQMVSFFNGMGGACAALISILEYREMQHAGGLEHAISLSTGTAEGEGAMKMLIIFAGLIIGAVSFSGSIIAYGKLEDKIKDRVLPMQQLVNLLVFGGALVVAGLMVSGTLEGSMWLYITLALALVYGILFVLPIGGADMPVVISLLNSFTGVAAACGGFLYDNNVMLMGGVLVGSAGTILTVVMCNAMNRSLTNVLIGNFGGNKGGGAAAKTGSGGTIREVSATDVAIMMKYGQKVIIVPGYGLAVAQAQHVCHELEELLEKEGVEVKYAIHPVAGRMPGHMNVLLAESNVSYDKLVEMEHINPEFGTCDVVLVVGANDVVNPAAKSDPSSPIYGMPILEVENARQVIVMKRSMKAGYAGIENELFYQPKTGMLFGDAKATLTKLVNEVKTL